MVFPPPDGPTKATLVDMQGQVVDDVMNLAVSLVGLIAEGDVFKVDHALQLFHLQGVRAFGLLVFGHDLLKAAEARHAVLILLEEADEPAHGVEEGVDVEQVHGEFANIDGPAEIEAAASHQHHQVDQVRKQRHARVKLAHHLIGVAPGPLEALVEALKLLALKLVAGIGLGDADAGDGVFQVGVDLGDFHAGLVEGVVHAAAHLHGEKHDHGQGRKDDDRQGHVDGA